MDEAEDQPGFWSRSSLRRDGLIVLILTLCYFSFGYRMFGPWDGFLGRCRCKGNSNVAIGDLRTLSTAQAIFREADRDQNKVFDYGNLEQLGNANLIDKYFASGKRYGYLFESQPSKKAPEFLWWASAVPERNDHVARRYFFTNQGGNIFFSNIGPITADEDCNPVGDFQALGVR